MATAVGFALAEVVGATITAATAATVGAIAIGVAVAGVSYAVASLTASEASASTSSSLSLSDGDDVPQQFPFGYTGTAGTLVYVNSYGKSGKTKNAYLVQVILLSDLPIGGLLTASDGDQYLTYGSGTYDSDKGYPIPEYKDNGKNYLWIKFYDGTQTTADSWLVDKWGDSDTRPYDSNRIGKGRAYVIVTSRYNSSLFSGRPDLTFVVNGVKLYDPREDDTAGGEGDQRYDDPTTWETTTNPQVVRYNIRRGIYYDDQWFYGLQDMTTYQLPYDNWAAAMDDCDTLIDYDGSGTEVKQYRCGGTISCDTKPSDVDESLLKACNGRHIDVGGIFKTMTGAAGASVYSFTDDDIIISEEQEFDQYTTIDEVINAIKGTYPEPEEFFNTKEAPPLIDDDYADEDGRQAISSVAYDCVPFPDQVQALMKAALLEERRWRKHTMVFPHTIASYGLEPGDTVTYTSTRNGYDGKEFRIESMKELSNLDKKVIIREVDPDDYDWTPSSDYSSTTTSNITPSTIEDQEIDGLAATAVTVEGDDGSTSEHVKFTWETDDIDNVTGLQFQVRLTSDTGTVYDSSTDNFDDGYFITPTNLAGDSEYQGRAKYISGGDNVTDVWSSWITVSTSTVSLGTATSAAIEAEIAEAEAKAEAVEDANDTIAVQLAAAETALAQANALIAQAATLAASAQQDSAISVNQQILKIQSSSESSIGTLTATIKEVQTTLTDETTAIASDVSTINAQLEGISTDSGSVEAAISAASTAYVDTTDALATRTTTLEAALSGYTDSGAVSAKFEDVITNYTDADDALAERTTSLESLVGDASSSAIMEITTSTTSSSAAAEASAILTATDGTDTAECGFTAYAVVDDSTTVSWLTLVADKVSLTQSVGDDASVYFDVQNGRVVFDNGSYMLVQGTGFGSSSNFVLWYGPHQDAISACTTTNGLFYLTTTGTGYFGGSLSAGTLTTKAATSSTSATASIETSEFGSNGGTITVTMSYSYDSTTETTGVTGQGDSTSSGTDDDTLIYLYRSVAGGDYSLVATLTLNGEWTYTQEEVEDYVLTVTETDVMSGSLTYTDPATSTDNRQYKAVIGTRSVTYTDNLVQTLSVICVEEE